MGTAVAATAAIGRAVEAAMEAAMEAAAGPVPAAAEPSVQPLARPSPGRSAGRRRAILEAALDCFLGKGFSATAIEDIRRASGASVGAIYHAFGSKRGIALALHAEALRGLTEAMLDPRVLASPPEGIVRGSVARALDWALANPRPYRFLIQARWLEGAAPAREELDALSAAARRRASAVLAVLVSQGAVRPLPWDVYQAVVLGPVHAYLALRAAGLAETDPARAAREFGDAAWAAVRA
jgi:AcrR family transcriptional regulator